MPRSTANSGSPSAGCNTFCAGNSCTFLFDLGEGRHSNHRIGIVEQAHLIGNLDIPYADAITGSGEHRDIDIDALGQIGGKTFHFERFQVRHQHGIEILHRCRRHPPDLQLTLARRILGERDSQEVHVQQAILDVITLLFTDQRRIFLAVQINCHQAGRGESSQNQGCMWPSKERLIGSVWRP